MNRTKLIDAIRAIATADGYHFYSFDERSLSSGVRAYPAIALLPPQFSSMEGRNHGKMCYSLSIHAMEEGRKLAPEARPELWAKQEQALLSLFEKLSREDFVIAVEGLTITPSARSLTNHGEVASTASAEVITFF